MLQVQPKIVHHRFYRLLIIGHGSVEHRCSERQLPWWMFEFKAVYQQENFKSLQVTMNDTVVCLFPEE